MATKKVIVIGGGAIGLCSAYYLQLEGFDVTVIDKGKADDYSGCSYGNAGLIVPSHFVPLAAPGVITKGMKWMLNPESPFYVKPHFSRELFSWVWKFYKASSAKHMQESAPLLRDLNTRSKELFTELISKEQFQCQLESKGLLLLYKTEKMAKEEAEIAHMANELGIRTQTLNREEVQQMEPQVKLDVEGAVYYPDDVHIQPDVFMKELYQMLTNKGVQFLHGKEVKRFQMHSGKVVAADLGDEEIKGDAFVLSTGSWSAKLAKSVGLKIPLQAGKGYNLTIENPPVQLQTPAVLMESKVAVTPMGNRLRFAGTMEIAGTQLKINQRRIDGIIKSIPNYMPQYSDDWMEGVKPWAGLRPCSADGLPYIGATRKASNLHIATGHAMMGLSLAPITGKLIADGVAEKKLEFLSPMLSPDRF
jgi:D-amino-acid dehydrogenase